MPCPDRPGHGLPARFQPARWAAGLALALPLCCQPAQARLEHRQSEVRSGAGIPATAISHPLAWYDRDRAPIVLKGRSASGDITFQVADHREVSAAELHLLGTNSASLIGGASQLLVLLNGSPLKQIPLDGSSPTIDRTIGIPPGDLRDGTNQLTLSVTQKAAQGCEAFDDPGLWTRISPKSQLSMSYRRDSVPLTLASLKSSFMSWQPDTSHIFVLYDPALARAPEPIMAIARSVARADAMRAVSFVARPLDRVGKAVAQTSAATVIILKLENGAAAGSGLDAATLSIARNPVGGVVMTIAAETPRALTGAARLIGRPGTVWPNEQSAVIRIPAATGHAQSPHAPAASPTDISFRATGLPTQTEHGRSSQFAPVTFWNPNWDSHAILYLHMAYSAGGGAGSMIQALVNGKMVNTIPLTNPDGGTYPDYKLLVPQDALKVGRNRLVLKPVFHMQHAAASACVANDFGHNLAVTVFSDSHLTIIGGAPVDKDDLAAMTTGVYPLRTIAIASPSPAAISAAATLGAKLAQVTPDQPLNLVLEPHPAAKPGVLVVGAVSRLPEQLLSASGISLVGGSPAVKEPSGRTPHVPDAADLDDVTAWLGRIFGNRAESAPTGKTGHGQAADATVQGFGNAAIMAVADAPAVPDAPGRLAPAIVLTAKSDAGLAQAMGKLVHTATWRQISGQAIVVAPAKSELQVLPAENVPIGPSARLGFLATRNPLTTVLAVLGTLVILILLVRTFVTLRRRRLHPSVKGVDER